MQPLQLLALLARGEPVSGAALAAQAGVTRAAIWKQVESLRARGVPVEARGSAGYCLPWPLQMLTVITFAENAGKTTVTVNWLPLDADDDERRVFDNNHASMSGGWGGTFEQLTAYLAGLSKSS